MLRTFTVELPDWVTQWLEGQGAVLPDEDARMAAAIALAEHNVEYGTGGPFGALVVAETSGEIVSAGVNRVVPEHCSSAHAEIVALSLAQQRLQAWNLDATALAPLQLVTSCEPCAMCLGAIPWSGVRSVLCGATKADAEQAGFDEGVRADDWLATLAAQQIRVRTGIRRASAARVLAAYGRGGGPIYNP